MNAKAFSRFRALFNSDSLHKLARKVMAMIGGEAMQSAFHFYLNILLLQLLPTKDYGIFALIMVIGGIGLTYIRAFCGMPVSILIGRSHSRRASEAYDVTFGSGALFIAVILGLVTGIFTQISLGAHGLAAGGFVGFWSLRSYLRMPNFALGHQRTVFWADAVFTFTGLVLSVLLLQKNSGNGLEAALILLVIANVIGILMLQVESWRKKRVSFGHWMRRRYGRLWQQMGWSGLSVTTANLQGQSLSLMVAGLVGAEAYAPIAAGQVLFVPLRIVAQAISNMMQPTLSGHLKRGDAHLAKHQAFIWTALLGAGALTYGLVMIFVMPHVKLEIFAGTPLFMIGFCCWGIYAALLLYTMPRILLEAANQFRNIAISTAISATIGVVSVGILLKTVAPAYSLIGALISEIVVLLLFWIQAKRALMRVDATRVAKN